MKKLRTGLEKRISYTDEEKNENIKLSIKVITRLTDINTGKEIIFLNFDDEKGNDYHNDYQTQFACEIGKKSETISEKIMIDFLTKERKRNFLILEIFI